MNDTLLPVTVQLSITKDLTWRLCQALRQSLTTNVVKVKTMPIAEPSAVADEPVTPMSTWSPRTAFATKLYSVHISGTAEFTDRSW